MEEGTNTLRKNRLGFLYALLSALFWGTYGSFIKALTDFGYREVTLAVLPPTVLTVFFLIIVLVEQPKALIIDKKFLFLMFLHGGFLLSGANYCAVKAITMLPVGIVSIVSFCHIIFLIFVTRMVFGYKITKVKMGAALIALIGISFVLEVFQVGHGSLNWKGILWAAMIPIELTIAYTLVKFYLIKGISYLVVIFYTNLFAGMIFWYTAPPWQIAGETTALAAVNGIIFWPIFFGFILVPIIGAYLFFGKAYQLLEPAYVSIIYSLDPVTATVLGFIILNQRLSILQLIGIVIILIPVVFIQYHEGKQKGGNEMPPQEPVSPMSNGV